MTTAVYSHADSHSHLTPPGHPERVERMEAVEAALSEEKFAALEGGYDLRALAASTAANVEALMRRGK